MSDDNIFTFSNTKNRIDLLSKKAKHETSKHIYFNGPETHIYDSGGKDKIYIPTTTGEHFHNSSEFVRLVMGPYGSGKTTLCLNEIVRRTCNMPAWSSGRRKARWGIVRNTSGELYSTTLQSWLTWFADLGDVRKRQKPVLTYEHTFNDGAGVVELELLFIALDREEDLRKIKSLELTGCYINELSEVPQGALSHLKGRVNKRYPSRNFCSSDYWSGIIADTNPPDVDHWIYKDFELAQLDSYKIFKQPPGLIKKDDKWNQNPLCDNYNNLAGDYYTKLAEGQTEDFIKVFCLGEYGSVGFGKKVYPEFNSDIHAVEAIKAIQGDPIHLGWDFGLTPSCIVIQISPRGQIRVLKEYTSEDMGIRTFAKNIVLPSLQRDFPYNRIGISRADPSGIAGDTIMEELSCIGELNSLGINTAPGRTNELESRIGSVRYYLNTMIDGQPAIIISRDGCKQLIRGFVKDYCYKRISVGGEERYKEVPHKNFSSHCFIGETYVSTPKGYIRIDSLKLNDIVSTPYGNKRILATMSRYCDDLITLTLSNGSEITCTSDHPFITYDGTVKADALQYSDILLGINSEALDKWKEKENIQSKNSMESNIIRSEKGITKLITKILEPLNTCIEMCGNFIMAPFRKSITFITSTMTKVTMTSKTFRLLALQNIGLFTEESSKELNKQSNIWLSSAHFHHYGISQKRDEHGIVNMERNPGKIEKSYLMFAPSVIKVLKGLKEQIRKVIALPIVNHNKEEILDLIMKKEIASSVGQNLNVINIQERKPALRVVQVKRYHEPRMVYDLTIEDAHCFFAEDILVHNCHDALQYIVMEFAADQIKGPPPKEDNMRNPVLRIF